MEPRRDGLVFSDTASYAIGDGFASRQGHSKYHHKNGTRPLVYEFDSAA